MKIDFDAVVIGAGVIGLACARNLSMQGFKTLVIEKNPYFGQETSSRNSEVIHSGIYYSEGSNKSNLCRDGLFKLYEYCKKNKIEHSKLSKWVVATNHSEEEKLHEIFDNGHKNGCDEIYYLSKKEIKNEEPELNCTSAFCSPFSGIIDSHSLMLSFIAEIESSGGQIVYQSLFCEGMQKDKAICLDIQNQDLSHIEISTKYVVNCAGLNSLNVATKFKDYKNNDKYKVKYFKGNYFSYSGHIPFSRLIYPVPQMHGLGVHLTLDLSGQGRFGPDVEKVKAIDYSVNFERKNEFLHSIRSYWQNIDETKLTPSYSGIRPKLKKNNNYLNDFIFDIHDYNECKLINLLGFESPGLTSCIAIADRVLSFVDK